MDVGDASRDSGENELNIKGNDPVPVLKEPKVKEPEAKEPVIKAFSVKKLLR